MQSIVRPDFLWTGKTERRLNLSNAFFFFSSQRSPISTPSSGLLSFNALKLRTIIWPLYRFRSAISENYWMRFVDWNVVRNELQQKKTRIGCLETQVWVRTIARPGCTLILLQARKKQTRLKNRIENEWNLCATCICGWMNVVASCNYISISNRWQLCS